MSQTAKAGSVGYGQSPRVMRLLAGIGMVHQHFMLVENLTVAENIALSLGQLEGKRKERKEGSRMEGWKKGRMGAPESSKLPPFQSSLPFPTFWFKKEDAIRITEELSEQFGLTVDPSALVRTLSVGLKQRVEILKALAVDARILILDEPTAVLSPQEVEGFFTILRKLQADGRPRNHLH